MKIYESMQSMKVYSQIGFQAPRGEKPGFGNIVFLMAPDRSYGYTSLSNSTIDYKKGLYKHYLINFVYKEKIGFKKYIKNNTGVFKKEFNEKEFPNTMILVNNSNKVSILKRKSSLLVNLGEWHDIYFQFQVKKSVEKICSDYFSFIGSKMNDIDFSNYNHKIVFIDIDQWLDGTSKKLSLDRKDLTNPIAILLSALYKFPETLGILRDKDIVFTSTKTAKVMKIEGTDLIKKKYPMIKQKLLSMISKEVIDETKINDEMIDNGGEVPVSTKKIDNMETDELVSKITTPDSKKTNEIRDRIISSLTKNLLGDVDDITDSEDDSEINTDDDSINEIKNLANNYLDEHPELLTNTNIKTSLDEVKKEVKKKIYIKEFAPKYSDKKLAEIQELTKQQNAVIGNLDDDIKDMASKTIDESDFSNVVETTNPNISTSKFVNFDKSYNEKKMVKDIDNAVGMLANASKKIFIVDKQEEDTSTASDLKKTLIYTLEDEDGRKTVLKFDVPIIFDDHYMMIKGNKKIIQHMLILKPLVKTGKTDVQIVSNYQKMFIRRKGSMELKTNSLLRFLSANKDEFKLVNGNGVAVNTKYKTTLEYNMVAKKIVRFNIGKKLINLDMNKLIGDLTNAKIDVSKIDTNNNVIIGFDTETNNPILMGINESFTDKIISLFPEDYSKAISKIGRQYNGGRLLMYSSASILSSELPLVLLLTYFEGFSKVMEKAGIECELIKKTDEKIDFDLFNYGYIELSDGYIKWKRYPSENSMLMNGFNQMPMELYSIDDLENKDMYTALLTNVYSYANQSYNLDQYYDFMIDPITKEILSDMHLPTDLVSLCILANKMLLSDEFTPESDLRNMRIRGNEVIAVHLYKAISDAYRQYRTSQHRRKPIPVTIAQDTVIKRMMTQKAGMLNDASSLNPVLEISKLRAITYKGENGTNEEHAFKLNVRAYNETMLGILGITTSPDSGVGINRQMTLEPNITSTRGYLDIAGNDNVEDLNAAQLLSPSELLTPLGAQHDDPTRTSMAYKQTMYMVLTDESDPVLIGNGVEKVLPYHLSSEFAVTADDDGEVVDIKEDFLVVKYKNGKFRSIDLSLQLNKNSAAGFYIESRKITNLKPGDKFKKNDVLAWDDKAFAKDTKTGSASMRLGPLVKVAIIPEWDIYEDSAPITHNASKKMCTTMTMPIRIVLHKDAYISKMVKVGDKVNAGESVMVYDNFHDSEEVLALIRDLGENLGDEIVETSATTAKTNYTGTVSKIDIDVIAPMEELSESIQEVVNAHWKHLKKREAVLNKYQNSGDLKHYKSGVFIGESTEPILPDKSNKVRGKAVRDEDGVIITIYVSFKDIMSRGDKLSSEFALKSINSHVIEEGLEPYSEFHPEETIDLITAPLSISARKTPSIFIAMFGNKILIEAKRHLKDYWNNN